MSLIIIDPGLTELSGHHFNYNEAIFDECQSRGIDVSIYAHAACHKDLMDILPIIPCFEHNTYEYQVINSKEEMIYKFNVMNDTIARNLFDRVEVPLSADDVILMLTSTVHQIVGIHNWYSSLPHPRPRICLQFMHQPWYLGFAEDPDFCTSLLREAMGVWEGGDDCRITFAADNDLLANFLHKVSGFPISILPMPIRYPAEAAVPVRKGPGRVRFGFLGDGRLEKGLHHFVRAILAQAEENVPNADFFIHISNQSGREAQDILKDVANCTVLCKQLSGREYWDLAESCDVIMLPYDPKYYYIRGSGILFEAMGLGKPIIVTAGSCLDWLMAKYQGAGMRFDSTTASLLAAIGTIAASYGDFEAVARVAGRSVREKHNPKAFIDALMAV
jgi:glycosyltransferase involved in cell wall biosynthesis